MDWEKRFDEKYTTKGKFIFHSIDDKTCDMCIQERHLLKSGITSENLKAFIAEEIARAKKEAVREVLASLPKAQKTSPFAEDYVKGITDGHNDCLDDIKAALKKFGVEE